MTARARSLRRTLVAVVLVGALCGSTLGAVSTVTAVDRPRFSLDRHPPPPDYSNPQVWAVRPGSPSLADLTPPGADPPRVDATAPVDVFYVHPTTYHGQHWNEDVADAETNAWTDVSVIARQLSVFNACCRLYAPRYRQAATGAVTSTNGDGELAYDLAYQDVRRAFRFYLAHDNGGRPFILAGHSQGALLIYRLIEEEIDRTPLAGRMVAAYAIGVGLSVGAFGRTYTTVVACAHPEQTGCIVSWNSVARGADASAYLQRAQARFATRYPGAEGRTLLCVNPLTFDAAAPQAPASRALGALPGDPAVDADAGRVLPPLAPAALSAACEQGLLRVAPPTSSAFHLRPLPGGSLHLHDFDFFYEDLRRNVGLRSAAYLAAHPNPVVSRGRR